MAYMRKEDAKTKRNLIKQNYPAKDGWKFSIRVEHHSCLNVRILKAPIQLLDKEYLNKGYENINHNNIEEYYKGQKAKVLSNIYKIINEGNHNRSDSMTDYFDVGFYVDIRIGDWDRPFIKA